MLQHRLVLSRELVVWVGPLTAAALNTRGLARVLAQQNVGIGYTCGFVNIIGLKGSLAPPKLGLALRMQPDMHTPKKIQPPVSAGYEGLLFPPEQSEKSSRLYWPKFQGISNDLFVDCTGRFSHISQKCVFFAISSQPIE